MTKIFSKGGLKASIFLAFLSLIFFSCSEKEKYLALKAVEHDTIRIALLFDNQSEIKYELADYFKNFHLIDRFDAEIERFLISDATNFPEKGQILVIGSSSIRLWKSLDADMQPLKTIRRGFGGATIPEVIYYSEQILFPYEPSKIVFYCGENDHYINTPHQIYESFQIMEKLIHKQLPETELYFVSIKPSIARMRMWKKMSITNRIIKKYTEITPKTHYIDVSSAMFNEDYSIKNDIFISDRLHMNEKGYQIWTEIIKPVISE